MFYPTKKTLLACFAPLGQNDAANLLSKGPIILFSQGRTRFTQARNLITK